MDEATRREAIAAMLAAAGVLGPARAAADGAAKEPVDWKAERQRVIACGLTEAEADCWELVAKATGKFFELPKLHPMDEMEVALAVHTIQHNLLSRPAYRRYIDRGKAEKA
jgi:hypothetical protein